MAEPEKHFTIKRLADRLDVSDKTVRKMIDEGVIGCLRIGSGERPRIRITRSQVEEYETKCSRSINCGGVRPEELGMSGGQARRGQKAFQQGAGIITLVDHR